MNRKTAKPFIHRNEEYVKLKGSQRPDDPSTPRETPERQASGTRGYRKPRYDDWTVEELRRAARELGVAGAERADREALIRALDERDASHRRS